MFSAAWEFTKRHKGKIIAGGVLIGSAIAYARSAPKIKSLERPHLHAELPNQARRHYIFDSTHRSCDQSITDLIPSITTQIENRFEVDAIKDALNGPELTIEQKLKMWDTLKVNVFSRIVSAAYGLSILTLTVKAQISILAADTCSQFERNHAEESWQKYLPESIGSLLNSSSKQNSINPENALEVGNRRIFLQCVQFFTLKGIPQLMNSICDAVTEELKHCSLKDVRTKQEIRFLFDRVGTRIGSSELMKELVAPLESDTPDSNTSVIKLLQKLMLNLESQKSVDTLNSLLDFYFSAALKMVEGEEQSIAKYIPSLSNAYPVLVSTAFDSPLFNSLYSSDVHQFAVHVFNS